MMGTVHWMVVDIALLLLSTKFVGCSGSVGPAWKNVKPIINIQLYHDGYGIYMYICRSRQLNGLILSSTCKLSESVILRLCHG